MLIFPESVQPNSIRINLKANNKVFTSSLNGSEQTAGFMGDKWIASISFDSLDNFTKPEIEILQTFVWSLQGVRGTFKMWNFTKPGFPAPGTPVIVGVDNTGSFCNTSGWKNNRLVLKPGDFIEFNNELKMVTENVSTSSTGTAIIHFVPPIRNTPPENEPIITDHPSGIFRLADDEQGEFSLTPGLEGTITLDLVEAIYVL